MRRRLVLRVLLKKMIVAMHFVNAVQFAVVLAVGTLGDGVVASQRIGVVMRLMLLLLLLLCLNCVVVVMVVVVVQVGLRHGVVQLLRRRRRRRLLRKVYRTGKKKKKKKKKKGEKKKSFFFGSVRFFLHCSEADPKSNGFALDFLKLKCEMNANDAFQ
jgi:ABC-type multidrug transport system fused ATPase/permease subunit